SWPPGHSSPAEASRVFEALLRGHAAAAAAIRDALPEARVGVAQHLQVFDPRSRASLLDWLAARLSGDAFNWSFYDSISSGRIRFMAPGFPRVDEPLEGLLGSADYFGMNYYRRELVGFSPGSAGLLSRAPGPGPRSDLGWEIYPAGLLRLLRQAH